MRGDEEGVVRLHVADDVGHALVVTVVSLIDFIPDWALFALLHSQASLLHHVGASDELDAQIVVE